MNKINKVWTNVIFLAITLCINALGALGLINGLSQKEISDMYVTLITPSPSTFSIWSVIYTLLIISLIVMVIKKEDDYYKKAIDEITLLFRISCVLNALWIVLFSFLQIELSVIFILGFAITLSLICIKLKNIDHGKRFLLPLTFGLYTGWLFIAAVVNIASSLVKLKWGGFGINNEIWAIIILGVSIVLVYGVLQRIRNAAFPLPVAFAYFGIYGFLKSPDGFKGEYVALEIVAFAGMVVLIGIASIQLYKNNFKLLPKNSNNDELDLNLK